MDNLVTRQKHTGQYVRNLLRDRFERFLGRPNLRKPSEHELSLWQSEAVSVEEEWEKPRYSRQYVRRLIQLAVHDVVGQIRAQGWPAYVVGGTLRDLVANLSRDGARDIVPRDIDLIVLAPSIRALEKCFSSGLIQRRTRFGGLHVVKELAVGCEIHFDVWPLAETWALKEFDLSVDMSSFSRTPFLNLDAVAIELFPQRGHRAKVFEHGFFEGIVARLIDINFEPNPFPDICAVRALITAAKLQFALTPRLAAFICFREQNQSLISRLRDAQLSHYGTVRCPEEELDSWIASIRRQLGGGAKRIELRISKARQMTLWEDHPPLQLASPNASYSDGGNAAELRSY